MDGRVKRAFLVLFLIDIVCLRLNFFGAGYHLDDWVEIFLATHGQTVWDSFQLFAKTDYLDRPLNIILLTFLHRVSGAPQALNPWMGQLLIVGLAISQAWLLFLLLDRLTKWRSLALTAAGLILLFPNRGGVHYRISLLMLHCSLTFILASLLVHLNWAKTRRWLSLAGSQLLYLLGSLFYESPMLMPLMLGGAWIGQGLMEGRKLKKLIPSVIRDLSPYGFSIAALLLWKSFGMSYFFGTANMKARLIDGSLANSIKVFIAGFGCSTLWPISLSAVRLLDAVRDLGWLWLLLPVVVFLLSRELRIQNTDKPENERAALGVLMGAILGAYIGTYTPYILSSAYMPYVNGIMSRLNGTGAWVGGMTLTLGLYFLQHRFAHQSDVRRRIPVLATGILLSAFVWTNWTDSFAWARAWTMQKDILTRLTRHVENLTGPKMILLAGAPQTIQGAPVFESNYDFAPALRMRTGRMDLSGNVVSPHMAIEDGKLVIKAHETIMHSYALSDFQIYDYKTDQMQPSSKLRLRPFRHPGPLEKIFLGPGMSW